MSGFLHAGNEDFVAGPIAQIPQSLTLWPEGPVPSARGTASHASGALGIAECEKNRPPRNLLRKTGLTHKTCVKTNLQRRSIYAKNEPVEHNVMNNT